MWDTSVMTQFLGIVSFIPADGVIRYSYTGASLVSCKFGGIQCIVLLMHT